MRRVFSALSLAFLLGIASVMPSPAGLAAAKNAAGAGRFQEGYTPGKTTEDYMETVLSRDRKPLGLKENVTLRNLLRQPAVKWAIRAGIRHALD